MKELSDHTRKELFRQCGIKNPKRNPRFNLHHICFKSDYKRGLLPRDFNVNRRENLIPLPITVHNELHKLVEETPAYRNCIESRIWIANYAYNGELDLL